MEHWRGTKYIETVSQSYNVLEAYSTVHYTRLRAISMFYNVKYNRSQKGEGVVIYMLLACRFLQTIWHLHCTVMFFLHESITESKIADIYMYIFEIQEALDRLLVILYG